MSGLTPEAARAAAEWLETAVSVVFAEGVFAVVLWAAVLR